MKKKLTAFLAAVAMSATLIPTQAVFAKSTDFYDKVKYYGEKQLSDDGLFKWDGDKLISTEPIGVLTDMKVSENPTDNWKEDISESYLELGATKKYDFRTTLLMSEVIKVYDFLSNTVVPFIGADQSDADKSYIENAKFDVTIINAGADKLTIPGNIETGKDMEGFTAVQSGKETISPVGGKIVIPGDPADTENGDLVYYEESREKVGDNLIIHIATEGKTTYKALKEALKYDLVLQGNEVEAKASNSNSTSTTYKFIGTVTGETPIYAWDNAAKPIATVEYKAIQNDPSHLKSKTTASSDNEEIAASVTLTTKGSGGGGRSGGGTVVTPKPSATATPDVSASPEPTATPTLTPTLAPDEIVVPEIFNSEDHYAYIIGYPEGDVRPANNISREEVATVFYRLLTDPSRAKIFDKENEYTDVETERWSNNAISTLENGGFITGYEDGSFKPANYITRAEFITIATRFYDSVFAANSKFTDVENHWAKNNINAGVFYKLIDGYEDGTFRPNQYITRAEVMKIVNNILNRHVATDGLTDEAIANNWIDNPKSAWFYFEVFEATMTHDYTRTVDNFRENWTGLKANPDWVAIEKTYTATGTEENRPY